MLSILNMADVVVFIWFIGAISSGAWFIMSQHLS